MDSLRKLNQVLWTQRKFFFKMKLNFFQSFFIPGTFHDFASSGVFFFSKFRLSTKKKRKFRLIILFLVSRANLWKSSKSKALCIFIFVWRSLAWWKEQTIKGTSDLSSNPTERLKWMPLLDFNVSSLQLTTCQWLGLIRDH